MILGLGHITIATNTYDTVQTYLDTGYVLKTEHKNLPNDAQKKSFLSKGFASHDLFILEKNDSARVEIIQYEELKNKSQASHQGRQIFIPTAALKKDKDLLRKITSASFEENRISIKTPIKSLQADIELTEIPASTNSIYLNSDGAVCIAFIVKGLKNIIDSLKNEPIEVTDIFTTIVSGRKINVALLKTYGGFFIELYELAQ